MKNVAVTRETTIIPGRNMKIWEPQMYGFKEVEIIPIEVEVIEDHLCLIVTAETKYLVLGYHTSKESNIKICSYKDTPDFYPGYKVDSPYTMYIARDFDERVDFTWPEVVFMNTSFDHKKLPEKLVVEKIDPINIESKHMDTHTVIYKVTLKDEETGSIWTPNFYVI